MTIFLICPDGYFSTNAFFLQFLNNFSPPYVASVIVPLAHIVSVVVSVSVTVPDCGVHNTVGLYLYLCLISLLTHFCDILSQTICYYLFISYLLIICILYLDIVITYLSIFSYVNMYILPYIYFLQDFSVSFVYLM